MTTPTATLKVKFDETKTHVILRLSPTQPQTRQETVLLCHTPKAA